MKALIVDDYDESAVKAFEVNALALPRCPAVERVEPGIGGNLLVKLRGGTTVEMSRRQSVRFRESLSL
jgi:hypothetical protein